MRLLARLRAAYGKGLAVWAEGLPRKVEGASSRHELPAGPIVALAILAAPPGPEELRWVLARVRPQVLCLLPPADVGEASPAEFLNQVAGMLRVALRSHGGKLDTLRMAARLGARQGAVIAALRGLEAVGKVSLRVEDGSLRAYLPQEAPVAAEALPDEMDEDEADRSARKQLAEQQARDALLHLLRETRAYRQAYATLPLGALLYGDE